MLTTSISSLSLAHSQRQRIQLSRNQQQQQQQQQHIRYRLSSSRQDLEDDGNKETDVVEEWHPHDPAYTTPQLLAGIWFQIAQAKTMVKGVRCKHACMYA